MLWGVVFEVGTPFSQWSDAFQEALLSIGGRLLRTVVGGNIRQYNPMEIEYTLPMEAVV